MVKVLGLFMCMMWSAEATATPVVHVREAAEISGAVVTLGSIASFSGATEREEALFSRLDLGAAPSDGKTVEWTAAEVSQKLHDYVGILKGAQIKIPESISLTRVEGGVTKDDLKAKIQEALKTSVTEPSWEIQVSDVTTIDKFTVPAGGMIEVVPPQTRPEGVASFEVVILNAEGVKTRKWVNARVKYLTKVAVLTRAIEPRSRITEADVQWQKKEISSLHDIPASTSDLLSSVAKFTLTPGSVVTRSQLERELALHYGEEVEVMAGDDIFAVTTKGTAQQNGFVGDVIKVRSGANNKILDGIVTAKGVVHVRY